MFDISFPELLLVAVIGLVVLGPERLPVAVRTVAGWIRAMRSLAANVQNELSQEFKLQELQESLKKVEEKAGLQALSPELKQSMDELRQAAESLKQSYSSSAESISDELKKATELTENYDVAVKQASDPEKTSNENDPDPEVAAKIASVVETESILEPAHTPAAPDKLATSEVKKSSHQNHSEN